MKLSALQKEGYRVEICQKQHKLTVTVQRLNNDIEKVK